MKMNQRIVRPLLWSAALLSIALAIACGSTGKGSRAPIFGGLDSADGPLSRPQVTLTAPATSTPAATGLATNAAITATFTKDMAPATLSVTSFTVTGPGATPVTGTVAYASRTATFTPSLLLTASTTYTATVTTAATDLAGNQLAGNQAAFPAASNYVWTFTTGLAADAIRPRVTLTVPVTNLLVPATGVALNTAINAAFTEDMAPATLTGTTFTLTGPGATAVTGVVSYAQRTATFAPMAALLASTTYTATITTAATDLAGNQLAGNQAALPAASNYIWTFTTGTTTDAVRPIITLTNPADLATGVVLNATVNASFSKAMDPATISAATFTVQASGPPSGPRLPGAVAYNAATQVVTFTPSSPLAASTRYTATLVGARDLAGNLLAAGLVPNPWSFTTGSGVAPGAVALGAAGADGIMATLAITDAGGSFINGDVSLAPGTACGLLPAQVNGTIHINDAQAAAAKLDLLAAYNTSMALPSSATTPDGIDLGAWAPPGSTLPAGTLPPGVYTNGSTMLVATTLTLDAGGNPNALWVFQIGSSLTTNTPLGSVKLAGGALAKNVFWVTVSDATIGVNTTFNGTIVVGRNATAKTGAVINGRILCGATNPGTIALDTNTVNVPAP